MKKTILLLCLATIFNLANAQQTIQLGKTTISYPDNPIRIDDKGYAIQRTYVRFVQDTLYYYEISTSNSKDDYYNRVEINVFPLKTIEYKYMSLSQIITEKVDGTIETEFHTWISMKYELRKKNKAWSYSFDKNGKMKKKKDFNFIIYSDSRDVFDQLKSVIGTQTSQ